MGIKFCLFIPAYNVAPVVTEVLKSISSEFLELCEAVICVDNCSEDNTASKIKSFIEDSPFAGKFRLIVNRKNYNLGGSTIIAINIARGLNCDYLLNLHSDGQAQARDVERILEKCSPTGENLVLGSRFLANSDISTYSLSRKFGNLFFVYLQQILLRRKVYDIGALMALPLRRLADIHYQAIPSDMAYQPLLIMEMLRKDSKMPICEIPISWGAVEHSSVNPWAYGLTHLIRCLKFACGSSFARGDVPLLEFSETTFETRSCT